MIQSWLSALRCFVLLRAQKHWCVHQSSFPEKMLQVHVLIPANTHETILFPLYFPTSPSLLPTPASFEQDRFFLTGSWWGVRRDASSHNLSPGADRLVARKCIQRVLSLHLPYFEVALPTLQLVVRDCVFISTTTPNSHWKETHVSPCDVCSFQCVCVCVCI